MLVVGSFVVDSVAGLVLYHVCVGETLGTSSGMPRALYSYAKSRASSLLLTKSYIMAQPTLDWQESQWNR